MEIHENLRAHFEPGLFQLVKDEIMIKIPPVLCKAAFLTAAMTGWPKTKLERTLKDLRRFFQNK